MLFSRLRTKMSESKLALFFTDFPPLQ